MAPTLLDRIRRAAGRPAIGTEQTGGFVGPNPDWVDVTTDTREHHPDLIGRDRYRLFDEITASDPTVRTLHNAVTLPGVMADWQVVPPDGEPAGEEMAAALQWNLGIGRGSGGPLSWRQVMRNSLLAAKYGSSTAEVVYGDAVTRSGRRMIPIVDLSPRWPHSISEYHPDPQSSGRLAGIRQDEVPDLIPGYRLLHHVMDRDYGWWTGCGVIRPAYSWAVFKRQAAVSLGIGIDRFFLPTPFIRYPSGEGENGRRKAQAMGRAWRGHEAAYFEAPVFGGSEAAQWMMDLIDGQFTDPTAVFRYYDQQILGAGLAHWLGLGTSETGSRAVASELSDLFYASLRANVELVAEDFERQVIRPWVEVNFGADVNAVPTLEPGDLRRTTDEQFARIVDVASAAGVPLNDVDTVNAIRQRAGLPVVEEVSMEGTGPTPGE